MPRLVSPALRAPPLPRRDTRPVLSAASGFGARRGLGSGLELQHCDATPDRHPYCNVAIQDLTPLRPATSRTPGARRQRRVGAGRGAPSGAPRSTGLAASAQRVRPHAHRHCLSAVSEANAASLAMRPQDRAPQGSRRVQRSTAPVKRRDRPPHAFAAPPADTTTADVRPAVSGRQQTGPTTKHANPQAGPTPSQPSSRICRPVSLRNRSSRFAGRCSVRNCGQATRASSNGRASWV